ncbi:MAG: sigma-54-dependent Fis family transcriptional regulator [Candidatus Thiodiazotropha sp. 6PLUC2]
MTKHKALGADTTTARQLFFEKGQNPAGLVPEVIARSWQRCAQRLDNSQTSPPLRIDSNQLNERREKMARLRGVAQPEMDALAELVSDSDSLVLLANDEGLILDAAGGLNFLRKAQQVYLQPGVHWTEPERGTNAIGTALIEKNPVLVQGGQHFLDANTILSCAAAPIVSPQGELLGVLDVSGDSEHMHHQALGMVRLAIQIIEHRLSSSNAAPGSLLRFHHRQDLLGTHREGILILDDNKVVGANRIALQLLDADWQRLIGSNAGQWLQLPSYKESISNHGMKSPRGQIFHSKINHRQTLQVATNSPKAASQDQHYFDATTSDLLHKARRVLDAGIPVLIQGETGVGKEVFARRLHASSQRQSGAFVAVNCAALPETLIESELFGYTSGAFTGAQRSGMPGRVREADGGILFLDEIGDMPLNLQARLLRVLQERQVTPLGGGQPITVDFALLCATNRDLPMLVDKGEFRADLYYRIQDFTLQLPPLREREDCKQIIEEMMRMLGGSEKELTFSESAVAALVNYDWPGNLRQVTSTLRTLIVLSDPKQTIDLSQLPGEIQKPRINTRTDKTDLKQLTRQAIEKALSENGNNVSATARQLGIHRSTLYRQMANYNDQA